MDTQIIGLIAAYFVIEAVKAFLPVIKKQTTKYPCGLTKDETQMLKEIYQIHTKTDDDGRPLVYIPKNVSENLVRLNETMVILSHNQEKIAAVLDKIANKI